MYLYLGEQGVHSQRLVALLADRKGQRAQTYLVLRDNRRMTVRVSPQTLQARLAGRWTWVKPKRHDEGGQGRR